MVLHVASDTMDEIWNYLFEIIYLFRDMFKLWGDERLLDRRNEETFHDEHGKELITMYV